MDLGAEIIKKTGPWAHMCESFDCVPDAGTSATGTGDLVWQSNTHMYGKLT
jgi:hypothetical protein